MRDKTNKIKVSDKKSQGTPKKVQLGDIAKSLGVSKALVSMVINNRGDENGISRETQEKVFEKIKALNYKPNQFARALRMGRSHTLGLIVSDITNPFYARMARSIENRASLAGYSVMVASSDEVPSKEKKYIETFRQHRVDGLIISSTMECKEEILDLKKDHFPFVLVDRYYSDIQTHSVCVENRPGAKEAVSLLLRNGYQRIGMLTVTPSHISTMKERVAGYGDALHENNLRINRRLIREIPFENLKQGVESELRELFSPRYSINALFVANNNLAVACMEYFGEMNIRVPQDLAFISFDDTSLFRFSYPPVTAVSQPEEEIGIKALEILLYDIENGISEKKQNLVLPTKLVIRRSCGSYLKVLST